MDESTINTIIQYAGIKTTTIHKINMSKSENPRQIKTKHCQKQNYIQHTIRSFFEEETYQLYSEFTTYLIATQSFCYLLDFIKEHNPNLVRKISLPLFNNSSNRMVLANHTLKQLNIVDDPGHDAKRTKRFSSILSLLNRCSSPMGMRLFQSQITNPVFDEAWLKQEYSMIDRFLSPAHFPMISCFRKQLSEIRDIEKVCRQLMIQKIYPASIYHLYHSVRLIQQMNTCLYENPEIVEYLCMDFHILKSFTDNKSKKNHGW
jgi:DNA mismatch repair protein MutS